MSKTRTKTTAVRPRFVTSSNYEYSELVNYERVDSVSQTVPDQALTLKDLIERGQRGLKAPGFTPHYYGEEMPDLDRMDLAEIDEFMRGHKQYQDDLKKEYEKEQLELKAEQELIQKAKAEREAKFEQWSKQNEPKGEN